MLLILKQQRIPHEACKLVLNGPHICFFDRADKPLIEKYHWRAVKSFSRHYARAVIRINGKRKTIRMHRLITGCHDWEKAHHINHNTLDNRRSNLEVLSEIGYRKIDGAHVFFVDDRGKTRQPRQAYKTAYRPVRRRVQKRKVF